MIGEQKFLEGVETRQQALDEARTQLAEVKTLAEHDETKWGPLTTEFAAMVVLIVAILIAAAISDSLDDIRAWTLVTVIGAAYIVSRGIAKAGTGHSVSRGRGRSRT